MKLRLGLALSVLLSTAAAATECPVPEGAKGGPSSKSGEERLQWLSKKFDGEAEKVKVWTFAWGGGYSALVVGQLGLMGAFPRQDQPDWYWGAISAAVGATLAILPLEATATAPDFHARVNAVQEDQVCALVAEGERRMRDGAAQQAFGTAWFMHVANVLFNAGFGLLYWLGYNHIQTAILNTSVGIALGEATLFTQPTGLVSGWEEYKGEREEKVSWHLVPSGLGLGFALRF